MQRTRLLGLALALMLVLVVIPGVYAAESLLADHAADEPVEPLDPSIGAHRQHSMADGDGERAQGLGQRYRERAPYLRAVRLEGIERLIQQRWISTVRGSLPRRQPELLPLLGRELADDAALLGVIDQFLGRLPSGEHL